MLTRRLLLGAALGARVFAQEARQEPPFRLPDGVELELDLVYARYRTRELRLDLFRPKTGRGPFPAVVYIHGGGWRGGSKAAFRRQAVHIGGQWVCRRLHRVPAQRRSHVAAGDPRREGGGSVGSRRRGEARNRCEPDRSGWRSGRRASRVAVRHDPSAAETGGRRRPCGRVEPRAVGRGV